jgi:hypothetical protein
LLSKCTRTAVTARGYTRESADASLSFDELHENVVALFGAARQTFEEIPNEAIARNAAKGSSGALG